jgi:hypothetical protein
MHNWCVTETPARHYGLTEPSQRAAAEGTAVAVLDQALQPTMGKVAAAHGVDLSQVGEPEMSITEVHRLVH